MMRKSRLSLFISLVMISLVLVACSEKEGNGQSKSKAKKTQSDPTFLLYKETSTIDDHLSTGDLYLETVNGEREKVAGDVQQDRYMYLPESETVLFLTSDDDLYEYKKGSDKIKIASDISIFESAPNDHIFYWDEYFDFYLMNPERESEKIASSAEPVELLNDDLYYLNGDGVLNVYNVETRREITLASNTDHFSLLNEKGDIIYLNDDSMLLYKKFEEEPIKISSKSIDPTTIEMTNEGFMYITDDERTLYQTSFDGAETVKIASDVEVYKFKDDQIVYLTDDYNLFLKKTTDEATTRVASDVFNFTTMDSVIYYTDMNGKLFRVDKSLEREEKANQVESFYLWKNDDFIYQNEENELFLNDKKLATDVLSHMYLGDLLIYATAEKKLYMMDSKEEPVVIFDDLSEYSTVEYQNYTVFANELSFSDISGYWKMKDSTEPEYIHLSNDGVLVNESDGFTAHFDILHGNYHYLEATYDDDYWLFTLEGNTLIIQDDYEQVYFEKSTKKEVEQAFKSEEDEQTAEIEKVDSEEVEVSTESPFAVEVSFDRVDEFLWYYLKAYADGDIQSLDEYIATSSPFYASQKSYMEKLNNQGIELEFVDHDLIELEEIGQNKYKVIVDEYFTLYHPEDGTKDISQTPIYTMEVLDGDLYLTDLKFD